MPYSLDNWTNRIASRSDLTGHLIHLTRASDIGGKTLDSVEILIKILLEECLLGSSTKSGFICGDRKAVCFQDTPLYQLAQNIYSEQEYRKKNSQAKLRYVGTGLMFQKPYIYGKGGRPVIYDKTEEAKSYLPPHEWWRIVKLELNDNSNIIDWTHEREWRVPDDLKFELKEVIVILPNTNAYKKFITKCRLIDTVDLLTVIRGIVTLNAVFF
ncbi:DUF2971 domain-containing protein [Scytonema sp. UIC 10036]|uniref:DUF2971 domain-containing protein n=1 Tax=Scytonema sp. UIC 10036 TaxID=2304196 RepID=UPI0012DABE9B|nr:DUF2971 domain-containing protein [Scytonema sp. UIC 10036]MUG96352.1 DUF2971 domain-containing protein [Scytonema sp. UIC 10036]